MVRCDVSFMRHGALDTYIAHGGRVSGFHCVFFSMSVVARGTELPKRGVSEHLGATPARQKHASTWATHGQAVLATVCGYTDDNRRAAALHCSIMYSGRFKRPLNATCGIIYLVPGRQLFFLCFRVSHFISPVARLHDCCVVVVEVECKSQSLSSVSR